MLLFNRIRAGRKRARDGAPGAPSASVPHHDENDANNHTGITSASANPSSGRRGVFLSRVHVSIRRLGGKRGSIIGGESSEPHPRPTRLDSRKLTTLPPDEELGDPLDSFSPLNDGALEDGNLDNVVPTIISGKIQGHHELWYRLAYGRSLDRRVSGGYGLMPARLAGKPLPHSRSQNDTQLAHITSWRSRPQQTPWVDNPGSPQSARSAASNSGPRSGHSHRRVMSIDYGNADEVVLSNTQDAETPVLGRDDVLPPGAPRFLIHPYDQRKVLRALCVATVARHIALLFCGLPAVALNYSEYVVVSLVAHTSRNM